MFFAKEGEKGLTATSANHLANIAKEIIKETELRLKNISFINKVAGFLANDSQKVLKNGFTKQQISTIEEDCTKIGELDSFIGWVREAIKAKEKATEFLQSMSFEYWASKNKLDVPEYPNPAHNKTIEDFIKEMSVKERAKYISLNNIAAQLGKLIHPGGSVAEARNEMLDKISDPISTFGSGLDTIVYTYLPSVEVNEVNNLFFSLQNKHREINAELNQIKFSLEEKVKEYNLEERNRFREEFSSYTNQMKKLENEFSIWKTNELKSIQKWKIIIPNELKSIFEFLQSVK